MAEHKLCKRVLPMMQADKVTHPMGRNTINPKTSHTCWVNTIPQVTDNRIIASTQNWCILAWLVNMQWLILVNYSWPANFRHTTNICKVQIQVRMRSDHPQSPSPCREYMAPKNAESANPTGIVVLNHCVVLVADIFQRVAIVFLWFRLLDFLFDHIKKQVQNERWFLMILFDLKFSSLPKLNLKYIHAMTHTMAKNLSICLFALISKFFSLIE